MEKTLYQSPLNSIKKHIVNLSLYRLGLQFCEKNFLLRLIKRLEPYPNPVGNSSAVPDVDSLITDYELQDLLGKYQVADKALKYLLIFFLAMGAIGVSQILSQISRFFIAADWLSLVIVIVFGLEIFSFWLGVYKVFQRRWNEWLEVMNRELLLDRIEYYAKVTSSSIIANILTEIEEVKETQKLESEKAKNYGAIQTATMETFFQMVDEREMRNKGKENRKAIIAFFLGYASQKTLDYMISRI